MRKTVFGIIVSVLILSGCNLINKDEPLPFYIKMPQPQVLVDPANNYVSDLGTKVVWIEVAADSFGFQKVPTVFPVIPGKGQKYSFYGGISELGQGFVAIYPFWKPIQRTIDVQPLDTFTVENFRFEYYSDTVLAYPFVEQFENASMLFKKKSTSEITLNFYSADKHERNYSAIAEFDSTHKILDVNTDGDAMYFPFNQPVYLEVTYKSDLGFNAGLMYESLGNMGDIPYSAYIDASPEKWNTVYIRLNNIMAKLNDLYRGNALYRIFIRAQTDGTIKGKILLDNVRVIYRR